MKYTIINIFSSLSILLALISVGCNGIIPHSLPQRTWTMPALLASGTAGGRPLISCNQSGDAVAVWEQSDGARNNIWAGCYDPGTGWGAAGLIESGSGAANCPQIAVAGSGNAIAVWQQNSGTRYDIWANRFAPGTGWGTAALIETSSQDAGYPQIAIDLNGNSIAVWHEYDGTNGEGADSYSIWANRYTAGANWSTAVRIESSPDIALYPQVAFNTAGNAIAVWQYHENVRMQNISVWSNRYMPGTGWGIAERCGSGHGPDANPQLDVDNAGNAFIIWHNRYYITGCLCVNH